MSERIRRVWAWMQDNLFVAANFSVGRVWLSMAITPFVWGIYVAPSRKFVRLGPFRASVEW